MDKHKSQNTFGEDLYIPIPRPIKPLLVCFRRMKFLTSVKQWGPINNQFTSTGGNLLVRVTALWSWDASAAFTVYLEWGSMGYWGSWSSVFPDANIYYFYSIGKVNTHEDKEV